MVNASLYLRLFKSEDHKSLLHNQQFYCYINYFSLQQLTKKQHGLYLLLLQQVQNILYISFFLVNTYLQSRITAKLKGYNNETDLRDSLSKF